MNLIDVIAIGAGLRETWPLWFILGLVSAIALITHPERA